MKIKSVKKAVSLLKKALDHFMKMPYERLKIHISKGNKKIGRVHNFSLAPILTCINCGVCKEKCYDLKAVLQYKNVVVARAENTAMIRKNIKATFAKIDVYMTRCRKHKYFRFHVSGDIISVEYLNCMIEIARKHPDWKIWTYTKAYCFVNEWIEKNGIENFPENLKIMFSEWKGLKMDNPYHFPIFTCVLDGEKSPAGYWKCPGNCDICKEHCRGCIFGESSYCHEH